MRWSWPEAISQMRKGNEMVVALRNIPLGEVNCVVRGVCFYISCGWVLRWSCAEFLSQMRKGIELVVV
jgi:hypothetical protein